MNWSTIFFVIEIILLLQILYILYHHDIHSHLSTYMTDYMPYSESDKEQFYFRTNCSESKLIELQDKVAPLFADDMVYDGILGKYLDAKMKKKIKYDVSLCKGEKSYTINKQDVYLCLKDEKDEYYDFNFLIYVQIHECAHLICPEIGHTPLFYELFDALLEKAVKLGIYDDTQPLIRNYCNYNDK
jgi:hypothetical protein